MAVKDALQDRFNYGVENIYRKTIKFILGTLTTGFEFRERLGSDSLPNLKDGKKKA